MKHIQESIIGRKGAPPRDWHTGDLVYMNINGPNRPGNRNYVWLYLDKYEAKRRINEFESNFFLQKTIQKGKSVFVQPGAGAIRCDYKYVGQDSEKFLSNFAQELIRMDPLNLDPKKNHTRKFRRKQLRTMKHIQESIIGKKGSTNKTIIPIPGTIEFMYEVDSPSNPLNGWKATDKCDAWYLLVDQEKLIVMLWSPKANHYPFLYTDDDWKWNFNRVWNLAAKNFPELKGINNPGAIYDLISDADHWDKYTAKKSITNVSIEMPKEVENLIRDKANLHFWK